MMRSPPKTCSASPQVPLFAYIGGGCVTDEFANLTLRDIDIFVIEILF